MASARLASGAGEEASFAGRKRVMHKAVQGTATPAWEVTTPRAAPAHTPWNASEVDFYDWDATSVFDMCSGSPVPSPLLLNPQMPGAPKGPKLLDSAAMEYWLTSGDATTTHTQCAVPQAGGIAARRPFQGGGDPDSDDSALVPDLLSAPGTPRYVEGSLRAASAEGLVADSMMTMHG